MAALTEHWDMHGALHALLRDQYGIVTRTQCLDAQLSAREIEGLLAAGLLKPMFAGVYRDPATMSTIEQRATAAVLAAGRGALASHRMALDVHRMRNYRCNMYEVTAQQRVVRPGLHAHRVNRTLDHRVVRRVPVTTPARTLLDCSTLLSRPLVVRFVETWLSTGVVKLTELDAELQISKHHPGRDALRRVMDSLMLTKEEPDSPPEFELGLLLVRHGLAVPELHHLVTLASGAVFELDWSYPEIMLAFEMDGYGVHLRSRNAFEHDRYRHNELVIEGWTILNFTARMLKRTPKVVVNQVSRLLDGRAVVDLPLHQG